MQDDNLNSSLRFGFDIGCTFTDFVLIDEASGAISTHKTLTTPHDPASAVLEGWQQLVRDDRQAQVSSAIHGTTLFTNALIERRGAHTAFLTTEGFRDVLEMGREMRYDIYDLLIVLPEPLVERRLRFEVVERMNGKGEVVAPLDTSALEAIGDALEADAARTRTMLFETRVAGGARRPAPQVAGVYDDEWRRTEAGWLLARRVLRMDRQ